jgi:imidazolonepropionase-like amidohydrolase|tara:strand:- start:2549 stop:3814 length:1266 start_codon:yes stop_codon:yes gene_type:complete
MFIKIFKTFLCFFYVGALYSETILIKNATIYDGVKNIPFEGNILIENETIKQVSSTNMQADFVIDASGMIVTPGIIGTDTNIGIVEIGALSVTRDDSSEIYSIGFSIHDAFNPKSTLIPWNRSNGVTSALSLPQGTSSPIGGLGSYFLLDGEFDITSNKDMVMIGSVGGSSNESRAETYAIMDDLLSFASSINIRDLSSDADIAELIEASPIAEFMELHPRDVKALFKLTNDNLPLIISTHRASDILKLIELKEKYNLNLIIKGAQDASLVASKIAESNTPLIINPINNIPGSFDELASNIQMASRLEREGIDLMFNTPRSHNFHLVRQGAGVAVANGMSYEAAISAITSTPAKVFNIEQRGEIKSGYFADIVIWDADPLEPSSMPEYVFINGKSIDLTSRSSRLRDRYTSQPEKPNTYRD